MGHLPLSERRTVGCATGLAAHPGGLSYEAAAAIALGAEALLAPQNEGAELSLGMIVGGFDVSVIDEGPKGEPVLEDVGTRAADAAHTEACALGEKALDDGSGGVHERAEPATRDRAVADAMPLVDYQLRPEEQIIAELACRPRPLGQAHELPDEMRPVDLTILHGSETELSTVNGYLQPLPSYTKLFRGLGLGLGAFPLALHGSAGLLQSTCPRFWTSISVVARQSHLSALALSRKTSADTKRSGECESEERCRSRTVH